MHEFNAGAQLLADCLHNQPEVKVEVVLNGWPKEESIFEGAAAIIFYMDGGRGHEVVQEENRRLAMVDDWVKQGVGIGCMHYAVEIVPDQAGRQFQRWLGGYYEHMYSCNPIWEPSFAHFPDHPITRGVKPFHIRDEWYFNMRFVQDAAGKELPGNAAARTENQAEFTPILTAVPSDEVRNGPYVHPAGPYEHIQKNRTRAETMMWVVERPDGGRGMGFTGGHFHDNWGNEDFRKVVLNSFLWLAHVEVPESGVPSSVSPEALDARLDPKRK